MKTSVSLAIIMPVIGLYSTHNSKWPAFNINLLMSSFRVKSTPRMRFLTSKLKWSWTYNSLKSNEIQEEIDFRQLESKQMIKTACLFTFRDLHQKEVHLATLDQRGILHMRETMDMIGRKIWLKNRFNLRHLGHLKIDQQLKTQTEEIS